MSQTILSASVSASPYDERYEMALVYCVDQQSGHRFSLTRFPGNSEIEVMVVDQIIEKVIDLEVSLQGRCLQARLPSRLAQRLGGIEGYTVNLDLPDSELPNLIESLERIFEGKSGFKLVPA